MKPENPERLWACVLGRGGPPAICADFERDDVLCDRQGWESSDDYSEITEYIRADIAAQHSAAEYERGKATAMANLAETGDMCDRAQDERDALRLEKAALVARIEKLRSELQNIFDESDSSEHSIVRVESMAALADQALTEDDALSGKGVG